MSNPAVAPAVALLAGVTLGWRAPDLATNALVAGVVVGWLVTTLMLVGKRSWSFIGSSLATFAAVGVFLGGHATHQATATSLFRWYEGHGAAPSAGSPVTVEGRLVRDATATAYGASLDVAVQRVRVRGEWLAVEGGVKLAVGGQLVSRHIDRWREGRRVTLPVTLRRAARYLNPGVPNQETALMWRGTSLVGSVKSALLVDVVAVGPWWAETAAVVRAEVRRRVDDSVGRFSPRSAGVVTAVLIGDRAGLGPAARRRLQEGGTYHVIAISGGNIAILSAVLLLAWRIVRCHRRPGAFLTAACLVAYSSIVGSEASVARATFAAALFLVARGFDHRVSPLNTLALSALCLVGGWPLLIIDGGFLLTFGATLGILVGVPPLVEWVRPHLTAMGWFGRVVALPLFALLAATVCAEMALAPISAATFSRVTAAGLILNFLAIPLMTIVQVMGLLAVGSSLVSQTIAVVCGYAAHLAAAGIVDSARLVDVWPWLAHRVAAPGPLLTVVYYGGLLALVGRRQLVWRIGAAGVVVASAVLIVVGPIRLPVVSAVCGGSHHALQAIFLDVDQADATLLRLPSGRSLLVDAGGSIGGTFDVGPTVVAPTLWAARVRRLDFFAITHGDPDHIGGAPSVMGDFRPREVWEGVPVPSSAALQELRDTAQRAGSAWRVLQAGDVIMDGDVVIRVWHPPLPDWERHEVRNDDSLVLEIRYGDVSFVLPGDIGRTVETGLSAAMTQTPLRVLKVPHHGSRTSSSAPFIATLRPTLAIVSAGQLNRFGHPDPDVVRRYLTEGVAVLETGTTGAVAVCTDGGGLTISRTATFR